MSASNNIRIFSQDDLTLPVELHRKYGLSEGDVLTLVDMEDGSSMVNQSGDRVAERMAEAGVTLDNILEALDEERERYSQEH